MKLVKNECIETINKIKVTIDQSPDRIKYAKIELKKMIEYIKKLKKEHPEYTMDKYNEVLCYKMKEAISTMSSPTRSDMYLLKTAEKVLKDLELVYNQIETIDKERFVNKRRKSHRYTSNMEANIKEMAEDIIEILIDENPKEFKEKFINNRLSEQEKNKLKISIKAFINDFHERNQKEMKNKYSMKLANTVRLLDEMGFLKKYNDKNNQTLDKMDLPMLKYEYNADKNKFGITDLTNPEFVKRFSLEEIIAMTSFYSNRLVKEVMNYNESLYIANKMGIIDEIYQTRECKSHIDNEDIREILAQLTFLGEIGKEVAEESTKNYNVFSGENKVDLDLSENNKVRRKAIEKYAKDYNEIYKNLYLTDYCNNFEEDLDLATILEIDRHNLYLAKDFAMESLMVMLTDKDKNMNWGYVPEYHDGKNSIQSNEKFVLVGVDMKGYNMPIKLHFEKEKLETFLRNYTSNTKLPVYEGNEDMEDFYRKFITTQIYMPLTKEQRKELKAKQVHRFDYRYPFFEHIKWMMHPNRYPDYLCDAQGKKKPKRYINISSGRIDSLGEEPEL